MAAHITHPMRQIMDQLDLAEIGGATPEQIETAFKPSGATLGGQTAIRAALDDLLALELVRIEVDHPEAPRDVLYMLTDAGLEALWALMQAEATAKMQAHQVSFTDRAALRGYLRGAA